MFPRYRTSPGSRATEAFKSSESSKISCPTKSGSKSRVVVVVVVVVVVSLSHLECSAACTMRMRRKAETEVVRRLREQESPPPLDSIVWKETRQSNHSKRHVQKDIYIYRHIH